MQDPIDLEDLSAHPSSPHYTNQALRTLKVMQGKAMEWKKLHERSKISLVDAPGRDRMMDDRAEDALEQAFTEPIKHRRTRRTRLRAWLIVVILQDSGMRPDEVYPMRIENIHWDLDRIWIPEGKTENARRFVAMSETYESHAQELVRRQDRGTGFPIIPLEVRPPHDHC